MQVLNIIIKIQNCFSFKSKKANKIKLFAMEYTMNEKNSRKIKFTLTI
jgi:hypothetical protein